MTTNRKSWRIQLVATFSKVGRRMSHGQWRSLPSLAPSPPPFNEGPGIFWKLKVLVGEF